MDKVYIVITEEGAYDDYMMSIKKVFDNYGDAGDEADRLNEKYGDKNYFKASVETFSVE